MSERTIMHPEHGHPQQGQPQDGPHGGSDSSSTIMRRSEYRGHEVEIAEPRDESPPTVRIDGTDLMVRREPGGRFSAPMFNMFEEFDSLDDLARSIADLSPIFMARREERDAYGEGEDHASGS